MNKNCVFRKPSNSNDMIHFFSLNKILTNSRTSIYENDQMRFSIDSRVVRVLIYDASNKELIEKIRTYFYGEKYEKL